MSAAVIAIRRKRLIRRFREAGAVEPSCAVTLGSIGERPSWIFDQLVRHGVFVATQDGRFYMVEKAAVEFLRQRRLHSLILAGILLVVFLLFMLSGMLGK